MMNSDKSTPEGLRRRDFLGSLAAASTTRLHHLEENLGGLDVELSEEELRAFRTALQEIEVVGSREPESIHTSL